MIRDFVHDRLIRDHDYKPEEVGGVEYRLDELNHIFASLASMQRPRLMTSGRVALRQWWTDGYEDKRRQQLEG